MKTHQSCPDCGSNGCLTTFDDGSSYCHAGCEPRFKPSSNWKSHVADDKDVEFKIEGYRGIDKDVAEHYNILTGYTEGRECIRVYPYPHMVKNRLLPKDFRKNSGFTNNYLFGMDKWNAGSSKYITVVEGEDDVPSAYQMLGKKFPVVGLPGASTPSQILKNKECYDYLNAFETIILATDGDDAGNKAAESFSRVFPNKCYRVNLTLYKDPNDYLTNGRSKDFLYAWVNRKKFVPENILNTPDQFLSLYRDTPEHQFVPTGIAELDEKIKGIMRGHFTVLKARTGIGKTELMRKIEFNLLKQGVAIASWHLEETKLRSLLGLVSYELEDNLTRRDLIEEKQKHAQVEEAITKLTNDEKFYQFFMRDEDGPDELIEQIKYFAEVCDVKYIFIEPIQDLVSGRTESSKEEMLSDLAVRLSKLCAELNIAVVTIAHTNDDGEIKYCRMIGQRASIIINLDRDKESTDEQTSNTLYLHIEKNRPLSLEGYAGCLWFNKDTFTLEEKEW